MSALGLFGAKFLYYVVLFLVSIAVIAVAVAIGISLRKRSDAKKAADSLGGTTKSTEE